MRIKSLSLKNIGPFVEANMAFMTEDDTETPVILITGENGTGKSIILDAIRGMFGSCYAQLDRDIRKIGAERQANIGLTLNIEKKDYIFSSHYFTTSSIALKNEPYPLAQLPIDIQQGLIEKTPNWIVDYWTASLSKGSYKIHALENLDHRSVLRDSLKGQKNKANVANFICHFDYLRDSRSPTERTLGERIYEILEQIIEKSLLDGGKLSHVARTSYEPMVIQNGQEVALANLSSGNAYLIQNMVGLLGRMYSSHLLRKAPLSELCQTPGILLIDEAENQLHPKWQKRFIQSILDIFPNLQIIATTHSPFIISSVPNARLFVCKSKVDHCIVDDETAEYSNKPVDEILMSPLFEATQPFNADITHLIEARDQAIKDGDLAKREDIESKLKAINPEYFSYFDMDKLIREMTEG